MPLSNWYLPAGEGEYKERRCFVWQTRERHGGDVGVGLKGYEAMEGKEECV